MQPAPPSRRTASSSSTRRTGSDEELRPYVIVSDIGKGSFATVYKGYHEETHHQVAIKTVVTDKLSSKLFENLQSEIQILKSLSHRHITRLIDIVRAEKNVYLIMEFCAGGDLTNYIKKRGRVDGLQYLPSPSAAPQYYPHPSTGGLDEVVVRSFLRQLARALKFLRHRNLIHRDIKPQNLLLNPASTEELARGHPLGVPILKVADFGFARSLPNAMMAETLCGSPLYMAPEILRYEKYDAKADLWSVGAVLYEMAVGKPPFRANNHIELLKKIEHARSIKFPDEDPPSRKHTSNSNGEDQQPVPVPDDIKQLIRALLRRQPAERASFEEFFNSNALAKSKFPRPRDMEPPSMQGSAVGEDEDTSRDWPGRPPTPEHHKIIPPEVLDPKAMIPPSRFNFRRPSETLPPPNQMLLRQQQQQHQVQSGMDGSPRGANAALPRVVSGGREHGREGAAAGGGGGGVQGEVNRTVFPSIGGRRSARPLSTEGSFIPGETEEDGVLRREYVLVDDTRAVEFNRAVDEISAHPRRPLHDRRMPPTPSVDEYPPDSNNSGIGANTNISINTNTNNITFPPPPHAAAPPLSSSPSSMASRAASNALHRALNLASKKLFGTSRSHSHSNSHSHSLSHTNPSSTTSSPRRPILALDGGGSDGAGGVGVGGGGGGGPNGERDPMEDELLASLEELAQKTDVLTHWADEMYEYVKAIPQKPLPDPTKFTKREGELEKHARRRKHADMEAEYNAVTCVAVYMLLMSFSQKGINLLREFQEHMGMKYPAGDYVVSEGFDDALNWFKEHFMKCNDRAALVKTWLPAQYDGAKAWLDQLVYDRALVLSRTAARKELLDQASGPDECEKLYEESLWCLYALQDDLLQTGNPFMEEDRETIATWIKRTKLRLVRCRARMAMNDRDRMNDARADLNLADVARIPAPWDARPTDGAANGVPQVFNSSS